MTDRKRLLAPPVTPSVVEGSPRVTGLLFVPHRTLGFFDSGQALRSE